MVIYYHATVVMTYDTLLVLLLNAVPLLLKFIASGRVINKYTSGSGGPYRLQQDEGLSQQVTQEVVVGQSDALKVSGGVDLLKQLRELRLQNVHLEHKTQLKTVLHSNNMFTRITDTSGSAPSAHL